MINKYFLKFRNYTEVYNECMAAISTLNDKQTEEVHYSQMTSFVLICLPLVISNI
jgi:hypothetical protein